MRVDYRKVRKVRGYASKREADMAMKLNALARAGAITELDEQVRYELIPNQEGERACHYIADFRFRDADGRIVVMDTKGFKTEVYRIKKKLMLQVHGIRIEEA